MHRTVVEKVKKIEATWSQNGTKIAPKWLKFEQIGTKMGPKWDQGGEENEKKKESQHIAGWLF